MEIRVLRAKDVGRGSSSVIVAKTHALLPIVLYHILLTMIPHQSESREDGRATDPVSQSPNEEETEAESGASCQVLDRTIS